MRAYFSYKLLVFFLLISSKLVGQISSNNFTYSNSTTSAIKELVLAEQPIEFSFFKTDFNFFSYKNKNMHMGFNGFFEDDLPDNDLKLTNFFMYNFGINYTISSLQISLFFENFHNVNITEFNIEPAYTESNSTLVYLEHDTPSMIHLSLVYSF